MVMASKVKLVIGQRAHGEEKLLLETNEQTSEYLVQLVEKIRFNFAAAVLIRCLRDLQTRGQRTELQLTNR